MSRSTLVIFLFLLWGAGSTYWYTCRIKGLCNDATEEPIAPVPKKETVPLISGPLAFNLNDANEHTGPGFNSLKDSLLALCEADGSYLSITGNYFSNEEAPPGFRNMGIARASSVKRLLSKYMDASKLRTSSNLLNRTPKSGAYWYDCIGFTSGMEDISKVRVEETNDGMTIFFPSGSAEALLSQDLVTRLNKVALELANEDGGANIVGHTDSQGDNKLNYTLGQKRAEMIRDLFIEKGVKKENLRASSMGETQPKGDNNTASGRAKNRRIEIIYSNNSN